MAWRFGYFRQGPDRREAWDNPIRNMNREDLIDMEMFHAYLSAGYALPNWTDDAAVFAFMVC